MKELKIIAIWVAWFIAIGSGCLWLFSIIEDTMLATLVGALYGIAVNVTAIWMTEEVINGK